MKIEYPKWLYHATEPARIVDDYDAHEALGDDWAESPVLLVAVETPAEKPAGKKRK